MQDKDFDQLLKERLDALEVQPSASSWNKIAAELDQKPKKKKMLPGYWMAAASVVFLASAVLWLYRPVQVVKLHPVAQTSSVFNKVSQPRENRIVSKEEENQAAASSMVESSVLTPKRTGISVAKSHEAQSERPNVKTSVDRLIKLEVGSKVMIAKQEVVVPAYVPKSVEIPEHNETQPANTDDERIENLPEHERRHKIKSIGSLVNFVVAQVDKRENKIIEFKDGEEGSEVSGINLGVLKFKSRSK